MVACLHSNPIASDLPVVEKTEQGGRRCTKVGRGRTGWLQPTRGSPARAPYDEIGTPQTAIAGDPELMFCKFDAHVVMSRRHERSELY